MLHRLFNACLLRPEDLAPSDERLEVAGVFNPGAIAQGEEVVLLVRVAERPRERRKGATGLPRWDLDEGLVIDWMENEKLTFLDPRVVKIKATGAARLTFTSHLRVVRSKDGRSVDAIGDPWLAPQKPYETYGVEDPRITRIGGRFFITYVAVSPHGAATALASTTDFKFLERHGIIFPSENKDVLLFPETINGEYIAFHRPNPATHFAPPAMWLARSPGLLHWGRHEPFHAGAGAWEAGRIGGGTPPIRTEQGWLLIYHGNDKKPGDPGIGIYAAGALLLDLENPHRVLRRSPEPFFVPETPFEREGFVPNVVFPTGVVERTDSLMLYYGAADAYTGVVAFSRRELLDSLV